MTFELCPPVLIDRVLAETFDTSLANAGFRKIRPRWYVRSRFQEMNDVIEFWRDKLELNFVWGLSLNFVPHITNGVENLRWHRTPKTVLKDLSYSGFGPDPAPGWSIRATQGEDVLRQSAALTRAEMLPKALKFFDSISKFQDLANVFREAARPNEWGWTLEMQPQLHLSYAFYLAKSGREKEARRLMSGWLSRHFNVYRPETLERISELFEQAVDSPYMLQ
jgi:hypothetical protein